MTRTTASSIAIAIVPEPVGSGCEDVGADDRVSLIIT
jgi:hypothetical protein